MTPTADALALEFSQGLHACLGPEQMREVVERNRAETAPGVCHSHDFCDANMVLYEVIMRHGMDPVSEDGMEGHGALWDQAWNLAKSREFQIAH
jgi:hypothetical protein